LLYRYFGIENEHHDEVGIDINRISLRDMEAYAQARNSTWKRLTKEKQQHPGTKHRW
jgi:hypothetical protein